MDSNIGFEMSLIVVEAIHGCKKTLDFKLLLETCEIDLFTYPTLTKRPAGIALLGCG